MLEIFVLLALFLTSVSVGKKGQGKKRFTMKGVRSTPVLALGALASNIVVVQALITSSTQAYRLTSCSMNWSYEAHTASEGPITVGYSFGDYTVTEIKECLESLTSINPQNKIAQEQSNRWIRIAGVFDGAGLTGELNNGNPIRTKLNWWVPDGSEVNIFAYNDSSSVLTTGTLVHAMGTCYVKYT